MTFCRTLFLLRAATTITKPRGPRQRSRRIKVKEIPPFKDFVQKTTIIRQYRAFLKAIRTLSPSERQEAQEEVQRSFRNTDKDDEMAVQMAIKTGEQRLKQVRSMMGYQPPKEEGDDSWLDTKDEHDQRGRVGVGWPWDEPKS